MFNYLLKHNTERCEFRNDFQPSGTYALPQMRGGKQGTEALDARGAAPYVTIGIKIMVYIPIMITGLQRQVSQVIY